ncbi:hypothetical protein CGRA01v4_12166 [Colletotrichum graminicola]|nr:hypothetical protein CGRA01v4_12166 [Colletotrichum graminicola]
MMPRRYQRCSVQRMGRTQCLNVAQPGPTYWISRCWASWNRGEFRKRVAAGCQWSKNTARESIMRGRGILGLSNEEHSVKSYRMR